MIVHRLTAALAGALLLLGPAAAEAQDATAFRADADAFIRQALARVGVVPGLAVAVVNGDEAVMTAGYGVADIETGAAVDADTRFYIASSTKSFTALAIAAMAARGEVAMDAPLTDWAGQTAMPGDLVASVSLTDLLSHRSGLDNAAISFRAAYSGEHTPQIMQALLAETTVREDAPHGTFRYSNAGYNLTTTLIEGRFGLDWRNLVRSEVLEPLGMAATTGRISETRAEGVTAAGHFGHLAGGVVRSAVQKTDQTMQSAGGLVSTARDMAAWLEVQINDGMLDGRRVFPAGLVASTHGSLVAQERTFGAYERTGYGLGWQVGRYGDDVLIHHFGNFAGSRAHVSLMPERRLGVAVMVNEDAVAGGLADLVANYVYDWFAGREDLEAAYEAELDAFTARIDRIRTAVAEQAAERARRPWTLERSLTSYVGTYVSPTLGALEVRQDVDALTVGIGVLSARAEAATEPETIRVELIPLNGQEIRFEGEDRLIYDGEVFLRR